MAKVKSEASGPRLLDMHAHLSEDGAAELALRRREGIATCFCAGSSQAWTALEAQIADDPLFRLSFGVHPWEADRYDPADLMRWYRACSFIGEIGLDSVWCTVDAGRQRAVFEAQLDTAVQFGKAVLLHTKGEEDRAADMIRDFPEPVCVHWFSGDDAAFDRFLDLGCYFTIGPDAALPEAEQPAMTRRMLAAVPAERILTETDGLAAITWALEQWGETKQSGAEGINLIPWALKGSLAAIARAKAMDETDLHTRLLANAAAFCQ
jgi:TatD DNase family protein